MEVVAEGGQVDGTSNERPVDENTFPQPAQSGGEEHRRLRTGTTRQEKTFPQPAQSGELERTTDKTRQNSVNTTFPQPAQSEEPERSFSTRQDKLNQPKGVCS